ncbi:hypothetical protein EJB05_11308, partial [Eragrostis curvula]
MKLQQPQVQLPWLELVVADSDHGSSGSPAAAKRTGKRRAGVVARGVRVFVTGLAEMVRKKFECSIPAVKFGHVAYIR